MRTQFESIEEYFEEIQKDGGLQGLSLQPIVKRDLRKIALKKSEGYRSLIVTNFMSYNEMQAFLFGYRAHQINKL